MGCVYLLEVDNGKCYIGATRKTLAERANAHAEYVRNGHPGVLYQAIRAYGGFTMRALLYSDNVSLLGKMETRMMDVYRTHFPEGYNLSTAGIGLWRRNGKAKEEHAVCRCNSTVTRYFFPDATGVVPTKPRAAPNQDWEEEVLP